MTATDFKKNTGMNQIEIQIFISPAIILATNKFIVSITGLTSNDFSFVVSQAADDLSSVKLVLDYNADLQGRSLGVSYSQARRLLEVG